MRKVALLVATMLLPGCNMIVSEAPWFGVEDIRGAPALRDGVWAVMLSADCAFDDALPSEQWPDCAEPMVVRGNQLLNQQWTSRLGANDAIEREFLLWEEQRILLVGGDPLILQMEKTPQALLMDEKPTEVPVETPWSYVAVRPLAHDAGGRITALERWVVSCGPIPPRRKGEESSPHVTDRPYPGLRVVGDNCRADSQEAVRQAARLTEQDDRALGVAPLPARWVRDGWR